MKKVGVFGSRGMLGDYVSSYLKLRGYEVKNFDRTEVQTNPDKLKTLLSDALPARSWIVNCVGVIKPQIAVQGPAETIRVNSMFPHILSSASKALGIHLLHITTDCVFAGKTGNYDETSIHDETDLYGRSKSLGEPDDCTVVRTSIIGEERNNKRSLIEWAKSQAGKEVKGFLNHTWNGITCLQFAKVAEKLMNQEKANPGSLWKGVRHVYSPRSVNKFELLALINEAFDLNLKIATFEPENACYRTLSSKYPEVVGGLAIPDLKQQLIETKEFTWI
jgi:dTDP-4-dehydrorhamnose reductase